MYNKSLLNSYDNIKIPLKNLHFRFQHLHFLVSYKELVNSS